jgi:serine/threonine protein kinase
MNETEIFQHYQVLRREDGTLWELGRGAMGVTYKAFDVNLRCLVALKVINTAYLDHPVARQRFIREARSAAQLRHRNIASVYHLGMDAQSFFYAMEFIDGETLDALVRRTGPLPVGVALRIALQAARALNAAARRRLLHRDIKPTNLMIVDEDEESEGDGHLGVKIIDFGLARSAVRGDLSTQLTVTGFVGTPQYASPEQLEEKELDARSDIYSLGVTLWYMLAGRPPFMGTLTSLVSQHLTKEPPWTQLTDLPEPVRALLGRMLQKDPALRPQSPGELRREIELALKAISEGVDPVSAAAEMEADDQRVLGAVASSRSQRQNSLEVGALVANRFQLMRLVGEGNSGRVFQAQDILSGDGRLVAVKAFNPELVITPQDYESLTAEVAKVRGARHANLLEIFALERSCDHACLIMEWGGEVTLVDVLRQRGVITLGEGLALLKQAATAADYASAQDLRRLELGLHQILITTGKAGLLDSAQQIGALLASGSPSIALKIDALGAARNSGDLVTWAGDVTLLPQRVLDRDTRSSIDGLIEGTYLHALGLLFYELINGAPPPAGYTEAINEGHYPTLPVLGEAGNGIMRRALSANPGFASNGEFFESLARALHFDPVDLRSGSQTAAALEIQPLAVESAPAQPLDPPAELASASTMPPPTAPPPTAPPGMSSEAVSKPKIEALAWPRPPLGRGIEPRDFWLRPTRLIAAALILMALLGLSWMLGSRKARVAAAANAPTAAPPLTIASVQPPLTEAVPAAIAMQEAKAPPPAAMVGDGQDGAAASSGGTSFLLTSSSPLLESTSTLQGMGVSPVFKLDEEKVTKWPPGDGIFPPSRSSSESSGESGASGAVVRNESTPPNKEENRDDKVASATKNTAPARKEATKLRSRGSSRRREPAPTLLEKIFGRPRPSRGR